MRLYFIFFFLFLSLSCNNKQPRPNTNAIVNKPPTNSVKTDSNLPVFTYEIVNTFKHDSKAFTQGLVVDNGVFYESTGGRGDSSLRKVEIESGKVLQKQNLANDYFAEGLTLFGGKLYQITWQEQTAFVYDLNDFKLLKQFKYQGEGWGLTNDGKNLIMSDGTHVLRIINPENFQTIRTVVVLDENGKPLMDINELEYVKGEIWANIWHSEDPNILGKPNYIARIDPNSGKLLGWIDLGGISPDDVERDGENTLNGIAFDEAADRIFVTGKRWQKLFEIKVKPR